jgi:DinB superfamily
VETCADCGFAFSALSTPEIAPALLAQAFRYFELLTTGDPDRLRTRPAPDVWSPLEYSCHLRDVFLVQETRIHRCAEDQPDFVSMRGEERVSEDRYNDQDLSVVASQIHSAAATLARTLAALDETAWTRTGLYHWPTTELRTVDWIGRHTLHESVHHFSDIERQLKGSET